MGFAFKVRRGGRTRVLRKPPAGLLGSKRRPPPSAAALRRQRLSDSKNEAQRNYPELTEKLDQLSAELTSAATAKPTDRHYYIPVLAKVYELVQAWDPIARADRVAAVNALQGRTYRKNSSPFGIVVGALGDRAGINSKTANRWANDLTDASNAAAAPADVAEFLRKNR